MNCRTIKGRLSYINDIIQSRFVTALQNSMLKSFYTNYYTPSIGTYKKENVVKFTVGEATVQYGKKHGYNMCLQIHWIDEDGTKKESDISKKWLSGTKRTRKNDVTGAMRRLIEPFLLTYRHLNHPINNNDQQEYHVDHAISFATLKRNFLKLNNNKIRYNKLIVSDRLIVNDDIFINDWISYHQNQAKLQILSATDNIKKGCTDDVINGTTQHTNLFMRCPNCATFRLEMNDLSKCKRCKLIV